MNVTEREALMKAVDLLNDMKYGDDEEAQHGNAEEIICIFLEEVGFKEAAEAFMGARDRVGFYYA